jgi:hypothetical protein
MRKILLFLFVLLSLNYLQAQTVVFNETFEGATLAVTSSSTGSGTWGLTTQLHYQGAKSDSCVVTTGDTTYLTTNTFSTTGNTFVMLEFAQICKIEFSDRAYIEVSNNNGSTWTKLVASQYLGSGQFSIFTNTFNEASYPTDWAPNTNTTPANTWWKNESFDISTIAANKSQVKVRFVLSDNNGTGSSGRYGWLLDNIKVTVALSELQPPTITYTTPQLKDSVYNYGPFTIQATITDVSGVDTALLIYSRNGGAEDTVAMTHAGNLYQGVIDTIPVFALHDTICYRIYARDASLSANSTTKPVTGCVQFVIYNSPPPPGCTSPITSFPYVQDFETGTAGTGYPSSPGTLPSGWTRTPTAGSGNVYMHLVKTGSTPNSYYTGPSGDHTTGSGKYVYGEGSYGTSGATAYSQSPCMDLTGLSAPQLIFWYHMRGNNVGTFTVQMWYGGQWIDIWTKSGAQGSAWHKAIINLAPYKSITQFRFKTSHTNYSSDMAFDDVKVWVPPANDAGVISLAKPTSPAISGTLPVKVGVRNFGSSNLTSVSVNWQVNGVTQTPFSWTGTLAPMTQMDSLQIGTYAFTAGAPTLKFWTSSPNGVSDGFTYNDTLLTSVVVCDGFLHGTYTVGTPTSDFADIGSAVNALNNCGIDSAVVFNVAASTYTGKLNFGSIIGVSATNTITFKGQGASTIIQATTSSSDRDVVLFNGGKHITLDSLNIQVMGSPSYANAIHVMNNSDSNTVRNCIISAPITTTSSVNAFIFSGSLTSYSTQCNSGYWTIENNTISGGNYGLSMRGVSSYVHDNKIIGNEIKSFRYYGIYSYRQQNIEITGNYIHDGSYSYCYGMYAYYNRGSLVNKNKISLNASSWSNALYLYRTNYGVSNPDTAYVVNNMISITNGTSTCRGLFIYYGKAVVTAFNSVLISGGSTSSAALYYGNTTGGSDKIYNNVLVNTGGGYAYYVNGSGTTYIQASDYNDLYATGTYIGRWGSDHTTLASFQQSSGKDANSVSANPQFVSNTDLHAGAVAINAAGMAMVGITEDIDGDTRATTPCIGADEFVLIGDDAGIFSLVSPVVTCPGDTANIIVELKNFGTDTLFTATINWKIDNITQTAYSYNDTILPGQSDNVQLGTHVFTAGVGHDMDFWTTMPNGITDLQPGNDSLIITNFKTAIPAGTYTVGGTGADYPSLVAVSTDLSAYGICGPVIFKINTGTYTDHLVLNNVNGLSAINTLTFTSVTGDSSDVIINYAATSSNPAVVSFTNISYTTVKNITFNVTGSGIGRGIALWSTSIHNNILNCEFNIPASTSSSVAAIYFNNANAEYNTFANNKLTNGGYAIYARGGSQTNLAKGNVFDNNIITGFGNYGIYAQYQDSVMIRNNSITSGTSSYSLRAIYSYYCDGAKQITGNTIKLTPTSYAYGMYVYYSDASASAKAIIANNMISITTGNTSNSNYGIYCYNSSHQQFYYNSVNITTGSVYTRGIYIASGNNIDLVNNIFSIPNGITMYISSTYAINTSDYNDLYSNANYFAYWNGYKNSLTALKTASGKDAHSMDVNPNFFQNDNLHLITSPLDGKATPVTAVTTDIDNDLRDTLHPDMGADEFTPPAQDITIMSVDAPTNGCGLTLVDVVARVRNTGSDTIVNNLVLKYTIDSGATYVSETVNASINPQDTFIYTFTTQANLTATVDKNFDIWVVGALPLDPIALNDTAKSMITNGVIPPIATVTNTTTAYGTSTTMTASSSNIILWYDTLNGTTPNGIGTTHNTPILFDTTDFYVVTQGSNGCHSAFTPLTVTVTGIPIGDVGVAEILVGEGCGMDSSEVIAIRVYNQGYGDVNGGISASFKVDNNSWITPETITDTIGSHDTITYTFTATANLYALMDTMFDLTAYVSLTGDPYHANDTLVQDSIIALYTPPSPVVNSPVNIAYGANTTLTATSQDSLYWYLNQNDTAYMATGGTYTTTYLYKTDTFFVQAGSSGGPSSSLNIGTQLTTYNANATRGYHFQSPMDFTITELMVPTTVTGAQNIQVVRFSGPPAAFPGPGTSFTTLFYVSGVSTTVPIPVNIPIYSGDYIGIIGARGTGIMHNSYGSSMMSNIGGQNVQISRLVYQSSLSGSAASSGLLMSNGTGSIGRVEMNYRVGIGNGCKSAMVPYIVNVAPPPAIDAGMYSVVNPGNSTPSAIATPVIVKIKNFGTDTLQNVNIIYEINGVIKDTFAWSGNVLFNDTSAPVTITTDTFQGGINYMRVWVNNANGTTQGVNANDTITHYFSACLNGTYTVGDTTSDFTTIGDALTALDSAGVCGHVIFNIKPGTYNAQMPLTPVTGMDSANTVTFQSITGDSSDVIIQNAAAAANLDYVVVFYGSSYYRLKNLTIKATGTSWARAIVYYNNAKHNIVENCVIESFSGYLYGSAAVYDYNTSNSSYNMIRNSWIKNGYWGIYLNGLSNYSQRNFILENNTIENFYYYGIYASYQDSLTFKGNTIKTGSKSANSPYGSYFYRCRNKLIVDANNFQMSPNNYAYGMRIYYCQPQSAAEAGLISNNFISVNSGSGINYGIYCYNSYRQKLYNNSINITGGSTSSRGLYLSSGNNISMINNIFSVTTGGLAYYINSPNAVTTSDYNDFYTTGTHLAYWSGYRNSLAALKLASGKETHSKDVNPMFYSYSDLHSGSVDINNAGFALTEVPYDIDGETRSSTTPDIGADEFTPPPNDASITALNYPIAPVAVGSNNVHVSMRNFGADTLVSASIAWQVNAVTQTPYSWTGSLPTGSQADSIGIGSYTFAAGVTTLKFWPNNPNNGVDGNHLNDTLEVTLIGCVGALHGTFTIGGANADYPNFAAAVMAIQYCGIDSHIVFNVNPGTYNEQIRLAAIPGAGDTATVTFQSSTADSTDVLLTYSPGSSANYTIFMDGADYIRFKHLTIESQGTSAHTVNFANGACNNIFEGNIIKTGSSASSMSRVISSDNGDDELNVFRYNKIENGYYGIYMRGLSSSNGEATNTYSYNEISGFSYYGMYFYYQDSVKVLHNTISGSGANYLYGMYLYYCNKGMDVGYNKIDINPNYTAYGARLNYCNATSNKRGRFYNNFISINGGSSSHYATYIYNSSYLDLVFNNVSINSGNSYSRALYQSSGSNIRILNNNLINNAGGYAYYINSTYAIVQSDHNNFYTSGSNFARWGYSSYANLAALQTASSKDSNSISVNPGYYSPTDLHVTNVVLYAGGIATSNVNDDIDGDTRSAVPCIGADEFTPQQWDAAVVAFNKPKGTYAAQSTSQTVYVRFRNFGTDTITTLNVGYQYASGAATSQTWTGTLLPGDTASILFTTPFTTLIGTKILKAYTMLPLDGDSTNDTLSIAFAGLPLISPSYCDNFDGQNIWATPGNEWQRGVPQGTTINSAHSAPNVWMTRLSSDYSSNADEYLLSPFFDFSNVLTGSTMKFWRNNKFGSSDGFNVEYSNDGGNSWIGLGFMGDTLATNWYTNQVGGTHMFMGNSSGWIQSTYNLSQFNQVTTPIQFRFHLKSNASGTDEGAAIDDFCIELPPIPNDVGVISIDSPVDSTTIGDTYTITVSVKNFGTATQTSIPVNYTINNGTAISETMTIAGGLAHDSVAQFSFSQQITGPGSDFALCAYTNLAGDIYTNNDQICENIRATAAAFDAGVTLLISPKDTTPYGANVVKVRIKNFGTAPMSTCDIKYYVNSQSNSVTETWNGTALNMGDSIDFTFTQTYNAPVGYYQVCALTMLPNDVNSSNDKTCKTVLSSSYEELIANGMKLWQNIPNPANGITLIDYEIPTAGKIRFEIVDVLGQSVMLIEEKAIAGRHKISLDANKLAAGIYYYTLEFDGYRLTKKMIVNK